VKNNSGIIKYGLAACVALGASGLVAIGRAGTPAGETSDGRLQGKLFVLPNSERQARYYSATVTLQSGTASERTCLLAEVLLSVWREDKGRVKVKFHRFSAYKSSGLEAMDPKGARFSPSTVVTFDDKKIAGHSFVFSLGERDRKGFSAGFDGKPSPELKQASELVSRKLLPLLFPEFPNSAPPEVGAFWGKKPPDDDLDTFTSHPRHVHWKVLRRSGTSKKKRDILVESLVVDNHVDRQWGIRSLRAAVTVQYDHAAKYVKSVACRRVLRKETESDNKRRFHGYEYGTYIIAELPAPQVLLPPKPASKEE